MILEQISELSSSTNTLILIKIIIYCSGHIKFDTFLYVSQEDAITDWFPLCLGAQKERDCHVAGMQKMHACSSQRQYEGGVLIDFQTSLEYKHKHEFEDPYIRVAACLLHRKV